MRLVVGLGNVGSQYRFTRHNAGFMVIDALAAEHGASWKNETKLKAEIATCDINSELVVLAKPTTMMNGSGEAVQRLVQRYKFAASDIWIVFDDVDTPYGRLKLRFGGGSSGHQGINSTIGAIGPNFVRAKFGISLNDRQVEPSEIYVLKPFTAAEQAHLGEAIAATSRLIIESIVAPEVPAQTFQLISPE